MCQRCSLPFRTSSFESCAQKCAVWLAFEHTHALTRVRLVFQVIVICCRQQQAVGHVWQCTAVYMCAAWHCVMQMHVVH